jgi:aminoglycoside phosphotransferase (APT) family kinase protein
VEGIVEPSVTEWLEANVGVSPPFVFELFAGGRSNLTYKVLSRGGERLVLRRPPTGHVLPTAHDMAREYRVVSALKETAVPVPEALSLCEDPTVTGAPFYVMEYVEGEVVRDERSAARLLETPSRRLAGESLASVLAALHAVDPAAVGLASHGRGMGHISRQLQRWHGQFEQSQLPGEQRARAVDALYEMLASEIPPQQKAAVVHGDYRLDNAVLQSSGRVRAVLDWEISTLGDPMADLGLLMVYWSEPGDSFTALGPAPTTAPGFPTREEMVERYAEESGTDVSSLGYYIAFGYFKLACILQGVYFRYVSGSAGGDRSSVANFPDRVGELALAAERALAT